jgi:hypothetical protein
MRTVCACANVGLNHLNIQPLWEVVKRGNVVFLPVPVILDIR